MEGRILWVGFIKYLVCSRQTNTYVSTSVWTLLKIIIVIEEWH